MSAPGDGIDLVDLATVKAGLRIEGTDDDAMLGVLITAASQIVRDYLKADPTYALGGAPYPQPLGDTGVPKEPKDFPPEPPPPVTIPMRVQQATIALVGEFYRSPDADQDKGFTLGNLPDHVTALLYMIRDPALA